MVIEEEDNENIRDDDEMYVPECVEEKQQATRYPARDRYTRGTPEDRDDPSWREEDLDEQPSARIPQCSPIQEDYPPEMSPLPSGLPSHRHLLGN